VKICGTGIDIIEVDRIESILKQNKRFKNRVFTAKEIEYCESKKNRYEHYAVRFAAKEAVWKALGRRGIILKNIEIIKELDGKPNVLMKKNRNSGREILVSLSHTEKYAVAHAIVFGKKNEH